MYSVGYLGFWTAGLFLPMLFSRSHEAWDRDVVVGTIRCGFIILHIVYESVTV